MRSEVLKEYVSRKSALKTVVELEKLHVATTSSKPSSQHRYLSGTGPDEQSPDALPSEYGAYGGLRLV